MFSKILSYDVFKGSKEELLKYMDNFEKVHIISGNPEVLYNGLNNNILYENFIKENSIIIPDGVGIVLASKIVKNPVKEKIAGVEFVESLFEKLEKENKSVYLLGAKKSTLEKFVQIINKKYPKLNIVGKRDGYFNIDDCEELIKSINTLQPHAIFVAMGSPRQESFIIKYMDRLNVNIFMGVGGSFDVISGEVNRAPKWMINLGLEWLYRVIKEPFRIKRLSSIPKFLVKVIKEKREPNL